ncbi:MAG: periplasmic protein involved in polysaccharide export [Segetibacter sp.]|nr:periplasmic protein involved in polysaccharide export [Segetibacter sp.]
MLFFLHLKRQFSATKYSLLSERYPKAWQMVAVICVFFTQTACLNTKRLTYFPELRDTTFTLVNAGFEPLIQKGDILYVGVTSLDPASSIIFNSINAVPIQNGANVFPVVTTPGLLVDKDGLIELPKMGKLTVVGKTKQQVIKEIQEGLIPYLKDPIVTVRFMNYRVTVLGEVNRPSTVISPNEKMTLFEALGLAGDMTPYGVRTNLLLIRDNNGKQETHRINLNNNSLFSSPYYYLQSNDVLYVAPSKSKVFSSTQTYILLPAIISSLSLLFIVLDRTLK